MTSKKGNRKMGKKVKVASIQIQYPDGETKQVSIEDARELFRQLRELFGEKESTEKHVFIERERWPWWWSASSGTYTNLADSTGNSMPASTQVLCCAE